MPLPRSLGCLLLVILAAAMVGCKRAAEQPPSLSPTATPRLVALPSSPLATQAAASIQSPLVTTATGVGALPAPTVELPTVTPTPSPSSTPFPTLQPAALLPEAVAQMAVHEVVARGTNYTLHQISRTPLGVVAAEWSPDGQHLWLDIAGGHAVMGHAPAAGIVIRRDGSSSWLASRVWEDSMAHAWSPDGQQLVFEHGGKVWVATADGQVQRELPLSAEQWLASSPRFSPLGNRMAVVMGERRTPSRYGYDLMLIDLDTGMTQVTHEDVQPGVPVWSPEGDALALQSLGDLIMFDLVRNQVVAVHLAEAPGTDACCQPPPMWVLDGTKVLAIVMLTPGVWLVDRDGLVERLDLRHPVTLGRRPPGLAAPRPGGRTGYAQASANGDYVAYTDRMGPLYVLDLRSNHEISTTFGTVTWSPTEPYFVRWGQEQPLALVDSRTGVVRQLAALGERPAWSPDGTRLVYWQFTPELNTLWLVDLVEDSSPQLLFSWNHPWSPYSGSPYQYDITPQWSPDGEAFTFIAPVDGLPEVYLLELHEP